MTTEQTNQTGEHTLLLTGIPLKKVEARAFSFSPYPYFPR